MLEDSIQKVREPPNLAALMPFVRDHPVPLSPPDLLKMEERKRPASHGHDDSAPPFKKQAPAMNGTAKTHIDAEMPWKDDLEVSLFHMGYLLLFI